MKIKMTDSKFYKVSGYNNYSMHPSDLKGSLDEFFFFNLNIKGVIHGGYNRIYR